MTSVKKIGGYIPVNQIKCKNLDLSHANPDLKIFVAGGSEIDRRIEAANRQVNGAYETADKLMSALGITPKGPQKSRQGLFSSIKNFILR